MLHTVSVFPIPHAVLYSSSVCSSNLFRGYHGPLPSGKPITPQTKALSMEV